MFCGRRRIVSTLDTLALPRPLDTRALGSTRAAPDACSDRTQPCGVVRCSSQSVRRRGARRRDGRIRILLSLSSFLALLEILLFLHPFARECVLCPIVTCQLYLRHCFPLENFQLEEGFWT